MVTITSDGDHYSRTFLLSLILSTGTTKLIQTEANKMKREARTSARTSVQHWQNTHRQDWTESITEAAFINDAYANKIILEIVSMPTVGSKVEINAKV